jgi:hypothetical protein
VAANSATPRSADLIAFIASSLRKSRHPTDIRKTLEPSSSFHEKRRAAPKLFVILLQFRRKVGVHFASRRSGEK